MTESSGKMFALQTFLAAKEMNEKINVEVESSRQDCNILREKFGSIDRSLISSEFRCDNCDRQLSIVDLFNSETMTHSPEFIRQALDSRSEGEDFQIISGNLKQRSVKVTCDCGKSNDCQFPEFALKTIPPVVVFIYTRSGQTCY